MVEGANEFHKLRVTNNQQYNIGRGRHIFKPGETTEVFAKSGSQMAEIFASSYLTVEDLGVVDTADIGTGEAPAIDSRKKGDGAVGDALADPSRTVYSGLDAIPTTRYTGLDQGEREDTGEYPGDAEVDRGAVVRGVAYEEQTMPELVANARLRGLTITTAMSKQQLVDALKQDDGTGEESNTNIRIGDSSVQVDYMNVAEESGHTATALDQTGLAPQPAPSGRSERRSSGDSDEGAERRASESDAHEWPDEEAEDEKLADMNVPQLRSHAKRMGIEDIPVHAKRADLLEMIHAKQAEAERGEDEAEHKQEDERELA